MRRSTPLQPVAMNVDRRSSAMPALSSGRRPSSMAPPLYPGGSAARSRQSSLAPRASFANRRPPSMAHTGRRTDSRPLKDRAYMQTCIRDIVGYVLEHGYPFPISPKILTSPSSRDYQQIFLFLVRHFDPNYEFKGRFEDEVPALLKSYGYPFTISKSALSAVGSPHTWPMLLGTLTWLLELIKYDAMMTEKQNAGLDSSGDGSIGDASEINQSGTMREHSPLFVRNINDAYLLFLQGHDEFADLDREIADDIESSNADNRSRLESLRHRLPEREKHLESIKSRALPSKELQAFRAEQEERLRKFETVIQSKMDYNASVQKKLSEKNIEASNLQREVDTLTNGVDRLKGIVAEQEANNIDVNQMAREREALKDELSRLISDRTAVEARQSSVKETLSRHTTTIADGLRRYNKNVEKLKLAPGGLSRSKDFTLEFTPDDPSGQGTCLSQDVSKEVLPSLRGLKERNTKAHGTLLSDQLKNQEKIDVMEEELLLQRDEVSKLKTKFSNMDKEYQAEKAGMAQQLAAHSDEIARREEDMLEQRRKAVESARESDRALENHVTQLRQFEKNIAAERARVARSLAESVEAIREQNAIIANETAKVARHFAEKKASAEEENVTAGGHN